MLLPQVDEQDVYCNGEQVDDINSFVEFVQQVVLDLPDDTAEDEDDDRGQDVRPSRFADDFCEQKIRYIQITTPQEENSQEYFVKSSTRFLSISYDILTPPPRA